MQIKKQQTTGSYENVNQKLNPEQEVVKKPLILIKKNPEGQPGDR